MDDLEAFSEEMQTMYGDKDRKLNKAMKSMTDFLKGVNELVKVYGTRIKANWQAAERNRTHGTTRSFTKSLGADYNQDLSPRSSC
jgi:hypothetical protein